ncbi:MAG: NADH-quinone oxidoreductase subunit G [Sulfuricella sp.]|nr:NADH-quinone oxidoreductase subunit G [Sulfuricella sp.]
MANIEIDGKALTVPDGSTVIDAADAAGIYIPRFCYHKKLSVAANCRMCLVDVEKAPKPLPACATPVVEGMKVQTRSAKALAAQKSVMEFILINHPLDCPICDQGGECQLQDLAVGYGKGESRYHEEKRVVFNKNLGPLISTDMTRCIHCTRCVRFGQEIGGIMEMGQIGRGEHSQITPFLGNAIESELSGNMIDLCPVGALTSKPFRFKARSWELRSTPSISPHDGLGSNVEIQSKNGTVVRVLPRDNEAINECWLSDRERFSYEGLNAADRLQRPMIKQNDQWRECDWQYALDFAASALKAVKDKRGAAEVGALATPHATIEELFLLQKLTRALGSDNIDFRLRQADFSAELQDAPWLGMPVAELSELNSVLLVGTSLRADHPLLALRLRQAVRGGASVSLVNPVDDDLLMPLAAKAIVAPSAMVHALDQVRCALAGENVEGATQAIVAALKSGEKKAVLLGNLAQHHPQYAELHYLAQQIAELSGAKLGFLGEAANSVGGYLAQAVPQASGKNAAAMLSAAPKAMILLGVEPDRDPYNAAQAMSALRDADLVVALCAYKSDALLESADVLLPIVPFSETSGTFVSTEGRVQSFVGAVKPLGESRPAWKVLRVLGNLFELAGFDYENSEEVRNEALGDGNVAGKLSNALKSAKPLSSASIAGLQRIGEVAAYHSDAVVRRASALQKTHAAATQAWMNGGVLAKLGVAAGETVKLSQGNGSVTLIAARDDKLPDGCVRVAAGCAATAALGGLFDEIKVERA